jgi:hypothetical protein
MNEADFSNETWPTAREEAAARHRFMVLYAEPFRVLEECGEGQGAFMALGIGLFLCERYFRYKSDSLDAWREEKFLAEAARHFGVEDAFFREFWAVYRHGMLLQGVPLATEAYGWGLSDDFSARPMKVEVEGKAIIGLSPWKFAEEMIVVCWVDAGALVRICPGSLEGVGTMAAGWRG